MGGKKNEILNKPTFSFAWLGYKASRGLNPLPHWHLKALLNFLCMFFSSSVKDSSEPRTSYNSPKKISDHGEILLLRYKVLKVQYYMYSGVWWLQINQHTHCVVPQNIHLLVWIFWHLRSPPPEGISSAFCGKSIDPRLFETNMNLWLLFLKWGASSQ